MFKLIKNTATAVLITTAAASAANYATGHPVPAGPAYKVMHQESAPCPKGPQMTLKASCDYFRASRRKELRIEAWDAPETEAVQIAA